MFTTFTWCRRPLAGLFALLSMGGCKARLEIETDHPLFPWGESSDTGNSTSETDDPGPNGNHSTDTTSPAGTTDTTNTHSGSSGTSSGGDIPADAGPLPEPERTWGPEMIIDARDVNAKKPQVTMDAAGNTLFVWTRSQGHPEAREDGVSSRYYSRTSGWGPIHQLAYYSTETAADLQVCGNPDGSSVITWTSTKSRYEGGARSLWVAYFSTEAGTSAPIELQDDTVLGSAGCGIDDLGEGMVVWSTESALVFSRGADSAWTEPEVIATEPGPFQRLSMNLQGNALVVARRDSAESSSFFDVWYDANSGWSEPSAVPAEVPPALPSPDTDDPASFTVALGGDDTAHLAWISVLADYTGELWTSAFTLEDGWSAPLLLADDFVRWDGAVTSNADVSGRALVLWSALTQPVPSVRGRRFSPGAGWDSDNFLDRYGDSMSSALGPNGYGIAAFRATNEAESFDNSIAIVYFSADGSIEQFVTERPEADSADPAVAINAAGQAVVAWEQLTYNDSQAYVIFRD